MIRNNSIPTSTTSLAPRIPRSTTNRPQRLSQKLGTPPRPVLDRQKPVKDRCAVRVGCSGGEEAAGGMSDSFGSELIDWVNSNGGQVEGIEVVKEMFGGWGLRTTKSIEKGQVLINLPKECHLTYDRATNPNLLSLMAKIPAELWGGRLALRLLEERALGDASTFGPYLRSLPVGVSGLPIFYAGPTIAEMQYPPVVQQVNKRCRWLVDFATKELQPLTGTNKDPFGGVSVDVNGLGWGFAMVTSRAFRTRGPDQPAAMLPLIDMCNHTFEPNCETVGEAGNKGAGVNLVAKTKIPEGSPITLNYGCLPNDFLLLDYGFVVPANPYDTVQLRFDLGMVETGRSIAGLDNAVLGKGLSKDGLELECHVWQTQLLTGLGLIGPNADRQIDIGGTQIMDPRLLAAIRILFLQDQSKIRHMNMKVLGSFDSRIDVENEARALRTLAGIMASAAVQFPTKASQDETLLTEGKFEDPNMKLAVGFRFEKKQVLNRVIQFLGDRLTELKQVKTTSDGKKSDKGFG